MPSTTAIETLAEHEQLLQAFREDCADRLEDMAEAIESADRDPAAAADEAWSAAVMRHAHSIKGMGSAFGFPTITLIAHKLEDYVRDAKSYGTLAPRVVEVFVEQIGQILAAGKDPDDARANEILRGLPAAMMSDFDVDPGLSIQALLIGERNLQRAIIGRELASAGIRITHADSPFMAIEMGVRLQPEVIISDAINRGLPGPDLARAFAAISATRATPFLLVTSLAEGDPTLDDLPPTALVVRKGASFATELADKLAETGIF